MWYDTTCDKATQREIACIVQCSTHRFESSHLDGGIRRDRTRASTSEGHLPGHTLEHSLRPHPNLYWRLSRAPNVVLAYPVQNTRARQLIHDHRVQPGFLILKERKGEWLIGRASDSENQLGSAETCLAKEGGLGLPISNGSGTPHRRVWRRVRAGARIAPEHLQLGLWSRVSILRNEMKGCFCGNSRHTSLVARTLRSGYVDATWKDQTRSEWSDGDGEENGLDGGTLEKSPQQLIYALSRANAFEWPLLLRTALRFASWLV